VRGVHLFKWEVKTPLICVVAFDFSCGQNSVVEGVYAPQSLAKFDDVTDLKVYIGSLHKHRRLSYLVHSDRINKDQRELAYETDRVSLNKERYCVD